MADSYNLIKPVEETHNMGSLKPAERRKERKQQQNPQQEEEDKVQDEEQLDELMETQPDDQTVESQTNEHIIDYRAALAITVRADSPLGDSSCRCRDLP